GHHIEEMAGLRCAQCVGVKRRRPPVAARRNHSVAVADSAVTLRTIDVVPLLSSVHHIDGDGKWKTVAVLSVGLSGGKKSGEIDLPARDRARNSRPRGHTVSEEIARL